MNINELIEAYKTDVDSPYHRLRYCTRQYYNSLCKRIDLDWGRDNLADINGRRLRRWHTEIETTGKIAMAHSLIAMLRIVFGFGTTILEDAECARLSGIMGAMRFKMPKARSAILTSEQVAGIRIAARKMGHPSIALAQAIQFECMLRQRDCIGEYVPLAEPGISDIIDGKNKWLRGIRWEEIDADFILTHVTSKRQKEIIVDLKLAPMVMYEFGGKSREQLPSRGPVIVCETTMLPWRSVDYRRFWRKAADACRIPKTIRSMDTRAGAITEALSAGAKIENVRKSATHSDIAMTSKYSRDDAEATADVMRIRAASRR